MIRRPGYAIALVLLLAVPTVLLGASLAAAPARAASTLPVTGNITGPSIVSIGSTTEYRVYGWGGPAVASNGTKVGTLTFYESTAGANLTGVSFAPASANFTGNTSLATNLVVGNATETLSIRIMISSTYQGKNESTNFTYIVHVVQPYVISATIINDSSSTVSAFTVFVTLDGNVIGSVNVSSLLSGATFQVKFKYPTLGLSSGDHTFAISLAQEHGLVTFANGQTEYTETVYVTAPAPDYTWWYVAGTVAFFGAIFIFASRVAARRRGATRR